MNDLPQIDGQPTPSKAKLPTPRLCFPSRLPSKYHVDALSRPMRSGAAAAAAVAVAAALLLLLLGLLGARCSDTRRTTPPCNGGQTAVGLAMLEEPSEHRARCPLTPPGRRRS
jgi:hypothetical protein